MSHKWTIAPQTGENIHFDRIGNGLLAVEMGDEKAKIFVEDLAEIIREELPKNRAQELFSEIEEKAISSGKARVMVKTHKDIKKGEMVCFTININRYLDRFGRPTGIRATKSGILF